MNEMHCMSQRPRARLWEALPKASMSWQGFEPMTLRIGDVHLTSRPPTHSHSLILYCTTQSGFPISMVPQKYYVSTTLHFKVVLLENANYITKRSTQKDLFREFYCGYYERWRQHFDVTVDGTQIFFYCSFHWTDCIKHFQVLIIVQPWSAAGPCTTMC